MSVPTSTQVTSVSEEQSGPEVGGHTLEEFGIRQNFLFPEKLSVIVIDDSYHDFDEVRRALRKIECFSISVTRAKSLEEARKEYLTNRFDVAFIDHDLGLESGLRFLKEIGGRAAHTVPILITGLRDHSIFDSALEAGAIGLVNKADVSPTLLETTIRYAIYTQHVEDMLRRTLSDSRAGQD